MMTQLQTKKNDGPDLDKHHACKLELKTTDDNGHFEGYGAVFGNVDAYGEIIAKGAFLDTLSDHKSNGTFPALLWQHRHDQPIGVYTSMREDDNGLFVKGELDLNTQHGKEAHSLLKKGALTGLSIGFRTIKYKYDEDTDLRTLEEVDLWEVSLVTFPANTAARVSGVKSDDGFAGLMTLRDCERYLRDDCGFSVAAATGMVGRIKRIALEERDVQKAAISLKDSQERLTKYLKG